MSDTSLDLDYHETKPKSATTLNGDGVRLLRNGSKPAVWKITAAVNYSATNAVSFNLLTNMTSTTWKDLTDGFTGKALNYH